MQLISPHIFLNRCFRYIQKDLETSFEVFKKFLLFFITIFWSIILFIFDFAFVEDLFSKIKIPIILFFIGEVFTHLPNYIVVTISLLSLFNLSVKYLAPFYVFYLLSFLYLFLI